MSIFGRDYKGRKNLPVFFFLTRYFPKAIVEVTKVCVAGNAQHNPELALTDINWSRGKSTDQLNTALRHMIDHATEGVYDEEPPEVLAAIGGEPTYHLAKAAWRILAALELEIEKRAEEKARVEKQESVAAEIADQFGGIITLPKPVTFRDFPAAGCSPESPGQSVEERPDIVKPRGWEFECVDALAYRRPYRSHHFSSGYTRCDRCGLRAGERLNEEVRQPSFKQYINEHGQLPAEG